MTKQKIVFSKPLLLENKVVTYPNRIYEVEFINNGFVYFIGENGCLHGVEIPPKFENNTYYYE